MEEQKHGKPLPEDDPESRMNRHERRRAKVQRRRDEGKLRARRNEKR
jgi:hypothetical protein